MQGKTRSRSPFLLTEAQLCQTLPSQFLAEFFEHSTDPQGYCEQRSGMAWAG